MKNLKDILLESNSRSNGKKIGEEIIKAYFGGFVPDKLSDEGMQCKDDKAMYKLIENMELYYVHLEDAKDPYDENDIDDIHRYVTEWVKKHNK